MQDRRPNPKLSANFFSRLFFCWMVPIFLEGKKYDLKSKDLYNVLPENLSKPVADKLETFWQEELAEATKKQRKPSLLKAIRDIFKWSFLKYAIHCLVSHLFCKILQPITMGLLIWHFDERSTSSTLEAYGYATAFALLTIFDQVMLGHMLFGMRSIGINVRVACASLLYRKIMKLPHLTKQVTGGRIINLLSNDVAKLEIGFLLIHILWVLPIQAVLVTYLIWRNVGQWAALAGVMSLMLLTVPVQALSGPVIARLRRKIAARTDERLLLIGEIIHGIRVIKMYIWERPFEKLVVLARRSEMNIIAKAAYLKSVLWCIMAFNQRIPLFIAITIYVFQGNNVSAYTVFTLIQYFNVLNVMTGSFLLRSINSLSEAIASIRRIQAFLLLDEKVHNITEFQSSDENLVISIKGVSASSVENSGINLLQDINLCLNRKLLYAVTGPVGGGKSSLLKLLLDELKVKKGEVLISGNISYSSQEPWLFRETIKKNIIFGELYDKQKYEEVVKACALLEDFDQLANGDQTIVGESVVTLSVGQCARINLARAVYRDADIYLIDDCLSAVDNRIGKRLFDNCLNGLLKNKTCILITHRVQYLKEADEIILVNNRSVVFQGDYPSFQKFHENKEYLNFNEFKEVESVNDFHCKKNNILLPDTNSNIIADINEKEDCHETDKLIESLKNIKNVKEQEETKKSKDVIIKGKYMYWKYFTAAGFCLPLTTFLAFVFSQILCSSSDYFVAFWIRKQDIHLNESNSKWAEILIKPEYLDSYTAILIFGILIGGIMIMSVLKMIMFCTALRKSNEKIHNKMAVSLLRTSMQFFEANDSGRILNRFSKDMGTVDERLQAMMLESLEFAFIILGVSFQVVIINKWSVIVIMAMGFLFWKGRIIAVKITRAIMRLEGQAKSPVFEHVNSSFTGIVTIRSCRAQSMACLAFDTHQDNHTAAASISQFILIAYSLWLNLITALLAAFITYGFVIFKNSGFVGADVGLAITQVLILCGILGRGISVSADIETQMISVERLFQYAVLKQEDWKSKVQKPSSNWPNQGKIMFKNVWLRYFQDDTPILKDLQFTIEAGAKIGIIGRTGAGKSSLISALFRLGKVEGAIYIDELDTSIVPLEYLRNKISIVPQEPILFSVSLRKNLDPLEEIDDATLWEGRRRLREEKSHDCLHEVGAGFN